MTITQPRLLKWLKLVHVSCASVWFGCSFALNIMRACVDADVPLQMQTLARCMLVTDNLLIFCGVLGTLITGIVYGIWTKWGFFRLAWLRWKWILALLVVVSGTFITGPAVDQNVQSADWYISQAEVYANNLQIITISGGLQLALLVVVLYLSVFRPMRKTGDQ